MTRATRPAHWLRMPCQSAAMAVDPASAAHPTSEVLRQTPRRAGISAAPPVAASHWRVQVRCVIWLSMVCVIDANGVVLSVLLALACAVDAWLLGRGAHPRLRLHLWRQRWQQPPLQFLVFGAVMLLNVALQSWLVLAASRPYFSNLMILYGLLLTWACLTTPQDAPARRALHHWSMVFICVLSGLLLMQLAAHQLLGMNLDMREWITGEPSRSGTQEGTEGSRPTSVFAEPSNHAVVVFALTFIHNLCGPRRAWLSVVSLLSCLLNNSGIGMLLALFVLVDEGSRLIDRSTLRSPRVIGGLMLVLAAATVAGVPGLVEKAYDRVAHPDTAYDPVAARVFVPQRIADFSPVEHLLGTGIANYASLDEGLTQYDSSFALGVYFQTGTLGLVVMILTLWRAWVAHSTRAALMLAMLFATKMSLIAPVFWALAALLGQEIFRRDRTHLLAGLASPTPSPCGSRRLLKNRRSSPREM